VAPRTAYGRTKREGEKLLQAVSNKAIIFRTAWLYSTFGNNFVKTMLRLGNERELLGVVFDQIGTPTYAADLANAIFTAINAPEWHPGVYHFTNEGVCSWYDFTHEIFQLAGITKCQLRPILSSEYHYQTPRPHFSVLNKSKVKQTFGISIPHWTEALKVCLGKLLNQ
jgi:dTDP-4-dehydrorhamnose reductase